MFPILNIGPLALQVPGLVLLAGLWLGLSLSERAAPRHGVHPERLYNLVFTALVAGVLGARLTYAGRFPDAFLQNPAGLVSLNPGLLDPFGGLAIALIAGLIYGQRRGLTLWPVLDALTPAFAIMLVAFALANLASGRGFGLETDLPWTIELWGARRHPSQIYEAVAGLLILAAVWAGKHRQGPPGTAFLQFAILAALAKLFLEGFRGDSLIVEGLNPALDGLRVVQLAAWVALAAALWLYRRRVAE